jgi:hypothetical protein
MFCSFFSCFDVIECDVFLVLAIGNSGMGNYHGVRSFNAFTHEKAVLEKSAALDQSIFFRPLLAAR